MKSGVFDKKAFIQSVRDNLKNLYRKTLEEADQQEIFQAVSFAVKDVINDRWLATQQVFDKEDPKIVYYMSMEFLMGRALGNNLINLKEYKEVREALDEIGLNLDVIEDQEPDPALGNGGLGRLAACFMDCPLHTRIRSLRLRDPLSLRYVQAEDSGRLSGRSA
mgnify:CR=1 FL=1